MTNKKHSQFSTINSSLVPPGYKQTEVGVIPEDWEVKRLDNLADIRSGGTPNTTQSNLWNGAIPWCTPTDITALEGCKYLDETTRTISEAGLRLSSAEIIPTFSVIMTSRATIGECAINTLPMTTNQGFKNLVPKDDVDCEFLYYLMTTQKTRLTVLCAGSTFLEIGKKQLSSFEVMFPPSPAEQRAIATALSDVDALLDGLDRLIAKKRDLKQAAMQVLLAPPIAMENGKLKMENEDSSDNSQFSILNSPLNTRLPGFEGEWEIKRIDQIADIRSGGTPSTTQPRFWDGGIPWCTPTDITALGGRKYLSETTRTISAAGLRSSSAETVPARSIIMTSRATIGECAINTVPMTTNQGFKNLIPQNDVDTEFLYYLMTTQTDRLIQLCGGSTFLEIGKKQLSSFEVMLPCDPDEQTAIAQVLSDMDAEIEALEKRRAKTRDFKQAMMQELLTGKTRLVAPQVVSEQVESAASNARGHNWAINEAVVIATLVKHFGKEDYPLGRKRYTKLSYLLHRHVERQAEGYLKKAAGPYNPKTKYGGPEKIAKQNGYIKPHKGSKGHSGFVVADNIAQAEDYFEKWYGPEAIQWLEQFRFKKNDDLELLATVDMAIEELRKSGKSINVQSVKQIIQSDKEWKAKLKRSVFSDANIARALEQCRQLFSIEQAGE